MNDLSSREGLVINAVPAAEAGGIARPLNACSPFSRTGLCEIPPL